METANENSRDQMVWELRQHSGNRLVVIVQVKVHHIRIRHDSKHFSQNLCSKLYRCSYSVFNIKNVEVLTLWKEMNIRANCSQQLNCCNDRQEDVIASSWHKNSNISSFPDHEAREVTSPWSGPWSLIDSEGNAAPRVPYASQLILWTIKRF